MSKKTQSFRLAPAAPSVDEFLDGAAVTTTPGVHQARGALSAGSLSRQDNAFVAPQSEFEDESIYRTVNVKLTRSRYQRLKLLSTLTETPMQQLLVRLLDEHLATQANVLRKAM